MAGRILTNPDLRLSTWLLLVGGVFLLFLALVGTFTGRISARFSWCYRAEEPRTFLWLVAMYCLGGVFLIGCFLYKAYGISN